jgi:WD40 repeat-containing protein SMU1
LIQQFLKENNLHKSLEALQEETQIYLNVVDNPAQLSFDILSGKWDKVFERLTNSNLPSKFLLDLYEHVYLELLEARETGTARSLLRQSQPLVYMREESPDRYLRLESMLAKPKFDKKEAYGSLSKEECRQKVAESLSKEVTSVKPSRLMVLLGQGIKWQHSQGIIAPDSSYDILRASSRKAPIEEDKIVSSSYNTIAFDKASYAECGIFTTNGQHFVTGTVDGFIEVWNYLTGKLRLDLKYQAEDSMMIMKDPVLCLATSWNSELLASGSQAGDIQVWNIGTGKCIRTIPKVYAQGVISLKFTKDDTQLISSGFDTIF